MPGPRPERLSKVDASFLRNETADAPMQIGALLICQGSAPDQRELREHVRRRLGLIPRFKERLAFPPAPLGRPFWIEDRDFDLDHHLRRAELNGGGSELELADLVAQVFSQPLDRKRPLWQLWFVGGLVDGRFALIYKTHHALADGLADVRLGTLLFDLSREGNSFNRLDPRTPAPSRGRWQLGTLSLEEMGANATSLARSTLDAVSHPRRALTQAGEAVGAVGAVSRAFLDAAPRVPLNVNTGPERSFAWTTSGLDELGYVSETLGGTINDVVLACAARAMRGWLGRRGLELGDQALQALVPVAIGDEKDLAELGNHLAAIRAPLPVQMADPVERLRAVAAATKELKRSKQPLGAQIVSRYLPQLNFSPRLFNLLVTNLPGPQVPLYFLGSEVKEIVPVAFLADRHALAIAAMSYDDQLSFGLIGQRGAITDIDLTTRDLAGGVDELVACAADARDAGGRARGNGQAPRWASDPAR
jgi:diacylglycerol O-acyltransferase